MLANDTILGGLGFAIIFAGGFMYPPALDHMRPEHRNQVDMFVYWAPHRFTHEGQRILRKAWMVQMSGVGIFALSLFL